MVLLFKRKGTKVMNQNLEIMNIEGIECYEKDGIVFLNLETCAYGLGFTQKKKKNDMEYVRWETVNGYLNELGFPKKLGKGDYIPENIFYRLAMKAKNATAEAFQAKIADEVIPSIRRYGGYIAKQEELSDSELLAKALSVANRVLEERERRIKSLEGKAAYFDELVDRHLLTNFTIAAKEFHMERGQFIDFLLKNKYVYRDSQKKLMPYNEHVLSGWFEIKDCKNSNNGWKGQQAFLTPKGKEAIRLLLRK